MYGRYGRVDRIFGGYEVLLNYIGVGLILLMLVFLLWNIFPCFVRLMFGKIKENEKRRTKLSPSSREGVAHKEVMMDIEKIRLTDEETVANKEGE